MSEDIRQAAQRQIDSTIQQTQQEQTKQQAAQPRPAEQRVRNMRRNNDALRSALKKRQQRDTVYLPELSKEAGEPIRVRARRLTVQELAASSLLPRRTDELVAELINRGLEAVEGPVKEYDVEGVTSSDGDQQAPSFDAEVDVMEIINDLYGDMNREAMAALVEMQHVVACLSVVDDNYRFYLLQEQVEADPERGILVWDVPPEDVAAIFEWALQQEEAAESTVLPFRDGAHVGGAAQHGGVESLSTERPDSV